MAAEINKADYSAKIMAAQDLADLEELRLLYLGRKGLITQGLTALKDCPAVERPERAAVLNTHKQQVNKLITKQKHIINEKILAAKLTSERIDVTLPGRSKVFQGSIHPVMQAQSRFVDIFAALGFSCVTGPEVETTDNNFTFLNVPEFHPARRDHDTFYTSNGMLLRSHTSPVQVRTMQSQKPPLKIITPGRVYRCDSDQTHTPMFHQLEGLVISEDANFAQLRSLLEIVLREFFAKDLNLRFRPGYFPFTEPSAEVDISWGDGWLEVLGCGMVHPNVLEASGIDSNKWRGYAFGLGLDRMAMLYYGIDDLRLMFENDHRFLENFA